MEGQTDNISVISFSNHQTVKNENPLVRLLCIRASRTDSSQRLKKGDYKHILQSPLWAKLSSEGFTEFDVFVTACIATSPSSVITSMKKALFMVDSMQLPIVRASELRNLFLSATGVTNLISSAKDNQLRRPAAISLNNGLKSHLLLEFKQKEKKPHLTAALAMLSMFVDVPESNKPRNYEEVLISLLFAGKDIRYNDHFDPIKALRQAKHKFNESPVPIIRLDKCAQLCALLCNESKPLAPVAIVTFVFSESQQKFEMDYNTWIHLKSNPFWRRTSYIRISEEISQNKLRLQERVLVSNAGLFTCLLLIFRCIISDLQSNTITLEALIHLEPSPLSLDLTNIVRPSAPFQLAASIFCLQYTAALASLPTSRSLFFENLLPADQTLFTSESSQSADSFDHIFSLGPTDNVAEFFAKKKQQHASYPNDWTILPREKKIHFSPDLSKVSLSKAFGGVLQHIDFNEYCLAGGAALELFTNGSVSSGDLDIFPIAGQPKTLKSTMNDISKAMSRAADKEILMCVMSNTITFYCDGYKPVQLIQRLSQSVAEVMNNFDLDCVGIAYFNGKFWINERFIRAITGGYNIIDPSFCAPQYYRRLRKYLDRGFAIVVPGYDMTKDVSNPRSHFARILQQHNDNDSTAEDEASNYDQLNFPEQECKKKRQILARIISQASLNKPLPFTLGMVTNPQQQPIIAHDFETLVELSGLNEEQLPPRLLIALSTRNWSELDVPLPPNIGRYHKVDSREDWYTEASLQPLEHHFDLTAACLSTTCDATKAALTCQSVIHKKMSHFNSCTKKLEDWVATTTPFPGKSQRSSTDLASAKSSWDEYLSSVQDVAVECQNKGTAATEKRDQQREVAQAAIQNFLKASTEELIHLAEWHDLTNSKLQELQQMASEAGIVLVEQKTAVASSSIDRDILTWSCFTLLTKSVAKLISEDDVESLSYVLQRKEALTLMAVTMFTFDLQFWGVLKRRLCESYTTVMSHLQNCKERIAGIKQDKEQMTDSLHMISTGAVWQSRLPTLLEKQEENGDSILGDLWSASEFLPEVLATLPLKVRNIFCVKTVKQSFTNKLSNSSFRSISSTFDGQRVLLKQYSAYDGGKGKAALLNEIRAYSKLESYPATIIPCLKAIIGDWSTGRCQWYLQYEWIGGHSLHSCVPHDSQARLLGKILLALHYCHARGVFHCNLSRESIILKRNAMNPMLVNFEHATLTNAGTVTNEYIRKIIGYDFFASPERIDLICFGAICYEVLTGHCPRMRGPECLDVSEKEIPASLFPWLEALLSLKQCRIPSTAELLADCPYFAPAETGVSLTASAGPKVLDLVVLALSQKRALVQQRREDEKALHVVIKRRRLSDGRFVLPVDDLIAVIASWEVQDMMKRLHVVFLDEVSVGGAGLTKTFFNDAVKVLVEHLFEWDDEDARAEGKKVLPSANADVIAMEMLGKLLSKMAFDGVNAAACADICPSVWTCMVDYSFSTSDLLYCYRSFVAEETALRLQRVRACYDVNLLGDYNFGMVKECCDDEAKVTLQKREHFVQEMMKNKLIYSRRAQLRALSKGLTSFQFAWHCIKAMRPNDLSTFLAGETNITAEMIVKLLTFAGFSNNNITPNLLKHVISRWNSNSLKQFLYFVTGQTSLPSIGEMPTIHVVKVMSRDGVPQNNLALPVAHTCSNTLDLAEFQDIDILTRKLEQAMQLGTGFFLA